MRQSLIDNFSENVQGQIKILAKKGNVIILSRRSDKSLYKADLASFDEKGDFDQKDAEDTMRALAEEEGIFCGVSSGGGVYAGLQLSKQVENATIVVIICDRGDRYLSTGVFFSF